MLWPVDFGLPPDDAPRRVELRAWLAEHPSPSGRQLADAGLVAPHWPRPWGLDADPIHQLLIDEELRRAGGRGPAHTIGVGGARPPGSPPGPAGHKERALSPP